MKVKASSSATENDDFVEFSLIDEDDDILMQSENELLFNETEAQEDETTADLDGVNFDEDLTEEDVGNISIGVVPDAHNSNVDQDTVSGFDAVTGSLWIYPTNISVRDYQYNIVQQALFKNTLVVLPTGLGKTFIAAVVMYNLYRWFPQGKIIFMAPTRPLVTQQMNACYNIMGIPVDDTIEMTGTIAPKERQKAWREKRVVFLTPQVMNNDISRGSCMAQSIKCIVVDEAHKALGNHAYCQVIREVVKYTRQFRVLALSATPGTDLKSVQQVISNLLISHIELRSEESIDIQPYTHERKVEKVIVPMGDELSGIRLQYIQILNTVIQRLIQKKVLCSREVTMFSGYLILKARDEFRQNPPRNMQQVQFSIIEADFSMAISLCHGLELLEFQGLKSLYNYLMGIISGEKGYGRTRNELLRHPDFNSIMEKLQQKFSNLNTSTSLDGKVAVGHPKMQRLEEIVVKHFKSFEQKSLETRVMIFSQYRDSVQEITSILKQHHPLVKVMPFIGQASVGKATKGYTQKEQLMVMKQFREGGYNTLVSTCVGEEGLDIGDVDLIVCFDASKSPIRLVQRMGRTGRKRQGRIVMLVTEGKEVQIYNKSLYSKKTVHKAILNGAKSLHFYQNNPRLVDPSVKPQCHKMYITVAANAGKEKKLTGKARKSAGKLSDFFSKKMKISNENEHITLDEYNSIKEEFAKIPSLAKCIPRPKCICLKSEKQAGPSSRSESEISFGEWMPWQNRLQKTFLVSHSIQSVHLVEDSKFIELQQALGDTDDYYGLEMSRINRDQEKRLGQSSIMSFLSTSQSKPENPNTAGCSSVNTVGESILIDSDTEENKGTALNQNNTLRARGKAVLHRSHGNKIKKFLKSTPRNILKGGRLKAKQRSGVKKATEPSGSPGHFKQKPKAKRKLVKALDGKQEVSKLDSENLKDVENLDIKNKSADTISIATNEEIAIIEGSEDVISGSPGIDRHKQSSFLDTSVVTASHEIHVPSPPDVSEVKYLIQTLKSKLDFADIDLEKLIGDWQRSERNLCDKLLSSFHCDILPADIPTKDNWDIEPAQTKSSPKLNRLNINIADDQNMDLGQQHSPAPGDSPRSPLFKSLSGNKSKADCSVKSNAVTQKGNKLMPLNNMKKSEDKGNLFTRRLEKSMENFNEPKTSNGHNPLEKNNSNKISGHLKSKAVADAQAISDSFFSDSLNCSNALKDAEAVHTNVSSFLTYTQALECLNSSEDSLENSHSAVATGHTEVLNADCDFLGNNFNNILHRQNLSSGKLHCYLKSPETSPPMNNISMSVSSNLSVSYPYRKSENCASSEPSNVRISDRCVDLNETPQFDLGFDLDDEEDFPLTPSKHCSGKNLFQDVKDTEGFGNKQNSSSNFNTQSFHAEFSNTTSPKLSKDNRFKSNANAICRDNNIAESWKALNLDKDNGNPKAFTTSPMSPELTDDSIVFDTPEKSLKAFVQSKTLPQNSIFGKSSVGDHENCHDFSLKKNVTSGATSVVMLDSEQETQAPVIDVSDEGESNQGVTSPPKATHLPFAAYASSQQTAKAGTVETNSNEKNGKLLADETASKLKRSKLRLGEKRVHYDELDSSSIKIAVVTEAKQQRQGKKVKLNFNLYDFDCDTTIMDVNASTPLKLPAVAEKVLEDISMNLTPIEKVDKVIHRAEKEESDDSFIIRRRKKPSANLNTSSEKDEINNVQQEASCSKQTVNLIINSDDEDDFEYAGNLTADKVRLQIKKGKAGQKSSKPKLLKKKCQAKTYIEEEAEVSGEDHSSDEREDFDDLYEASFIDNNTQMVHSSHTDMQAVYLKSVKSPPLPGHFKLVYDRKVKDNIDIYSQELSEDHGNSSYEEDSFCVGSDDIELSFSEEEPSQEKFTRLSKKSKKPKKLAGTKRIVKMCDSSSDEGDKIVLTQEFSVIDRKNARKMLSSSEDEAERKPMSNSRFTANQSATKDNPRGIQKGIQPCLSQPVTSTKAPTASDLINNDVGSAEAPKAEEAVNFLLLEEADWFDDADLLGQDVIDGAEVSEVMKHNSTFSSHDTMSTSGSTNSTSPILSSKKSRINLFTKNSTANRVETKTSDFSSCIPASDTRSSFMTPFNTSGNCFNSSTAFSHQNVHKSACGDLTSFEAKTAKLPLTREERLQRQREKQEKFQLKLKQVQLCSSAPRTLPESPLASDASATKYPLEANQSSENSVPESNASSSSFTRILSAKPTRELQILVDSREVSGAQNIISALRIKHSINVTAWQISNCDYILSNHLAADRVLWSAFSNSTNTGKLAARLCEMQALYNRCVLIIETDPVKPGLEKAKKAGHRTKHLDTTLSYLIQTKVKIYFTDSNEETALLLSQLCHIEDKKGRALDVPTIITSRQEEMMKLVLHFPGIIIPQALNLVHHFRSLADLIDSSPSLIQERGRMSSSSAQAIHQFLRYKFDIQMLPNQK